MTEDLSSPPPTVQDVLESIEREWTALLTAFSDLDSSQMTTAGAEGWTVKDELAHVAAWARGVAALVRKQRRYPPMGLPEDAAPNTVGIEKMNEMIFERNRDRPLDEVLAELNAAHKDALSAISDMSDEDLMRPYDDYQPQDNRPDGHTPVLWRIAGNNTVTTPNTEKPSTICGARHEREEEGCRYRRIRLHRKSVVARLSRAVRPDLVGRANR